MFDIQLFKCFHTHQLEHLGYNIRLESLALQEGGILDIKPVMCFKQTVQSKIAIG